MLAGLLAPLRLVLQRSFADWLIVAATWLVVVCAATLVAIGVLYGDAVALTGLRRILDDQPPQATRIQVTMRATPAELPDIEAAVDRQVGRILGWTDGELVTQAVSESYALPDQPADDLTGLVVFSAFEALERHATLEDGAWPDGGADPVQASVSRAAATALDLAVGDELTVTSQRADDRSVSVRIAGIWQPNDLADPYWSAGELAHTGSSEASSFVTHGPLVVEWDDLLGRVVSRSVELTYRALPEFDNLAVDDVGWMRSDTAALERRLADSLGERTYFQVDTELDTILADVNRSLLVSRSGVVVLTIQFAVLAGYALLLVAGLLIDQRRIETALLRSRGAGVAQVALFSFLEALLLVVPAVIVAPWLATAVLGVLNVIGPLADAGVRIAPRVDDGVVIATAVAGAAAVLGLVLPVLGAGRGLAAVRQTISRQGTRSLAQRLGIDVALVVLAGVGLWQLRQYGAPLTQTVRGTLGLDPLLVAAPAIGLLAGSILALRIVPRAAELGERLLVRRRDLVGPLGARQLSRRPLRYTRSALLLMLAAALGTFAGAYASTWTGSQADQAAYRTAADVRVQMSGFSTLPEWAVGQAIRSVDGVESALPVAIDTYDHGDEDGTILALDAERAASVVTFRPDLAGAPLDELLGRLVPEQGPVSGLTLDGEPSALVVEATASLRSIVPPDVSPVDEFTRGLRGIVPSAVIRDVDGAVYRVTGDRLGVGLGAQQSEISLEADLDGATVRPAYPIELIGIELEIQLPPSTYGVGSLALDAVSVVADGRLTTLPANAVDPIVATDELPLAGLGAAPVGSLVAPFGRADAVVRIPVLASQRYLELTGFEIGADLEVGNLTARRSVEIVGSVSAFPTLDPSVPFLIADLGTVAAADLARGSLPTIAEWWLDVAPGRAEGVAAELAAGRYSTESAVGVDELRRDLLSDPVALGVIGALVLGALAAVVFAAIGFVVSATVSTRERLGEFALLQALGLSHRQLFGWLSIENAFLLAVGLLAGTGLGLVLAWVVLPFVTLTQAGTLAVPPVQVIIPWAAYGVLYLVALVALGITVLVIGRLVARVRVSGVLRAGGE